jgi:hypothetical protein
MALVGEGIKAPSLILPQRGRESHGPSGEGKFMVPEGREILSFVTVAKDRSLERGVIYWDSA